MTELSLAGLKSRLAYLWIGVRSLESLHTSASTQLSGSIAHMLNDRKPAHCGTRIFAVCSKMPRHVSFGLCCTEAADFGKQQAPNFFQLFQLFFLLFSSSDALIPKPFDPNFSLSLLMSFSISNLEGRSSKLVCHSDVWINPQFPGSLQTPERLQNALNCRLNTGFSIFSIRRKFYFFSWISTKRIKKLKPQPNEFAACLRFECPSLFAYSLCKSR